MTALHETEGTAGDWTFTYDAKTTTNDATRKATFLPSS